MRSEGWFGDEGVVGLTGGLSAASFEGSIGHHLPGGTDLGELGDILNGFVYEGIGRLHS